VGVEGLIFLLGAGVGAGLDSNKTVRFRFAIVLGLVNKMF
jgi:hypothetical protein